MTELSQWLAQKTEESKREPSASLYSLIYDGKLWSYPFRRLAWPLVTATWKTAVGYMIWRQVGEDLPLFSWGELFTWVQIVYLTEFLVSALLESARAELRSSFRPASQVYSHREKRYFVWANLISLSPLLYFLVILGRDLTYSGRYFGFYDALTLIFLARLWLSTPLRFELGLFAFARRTRLYVWNWIAPSLAFLGVYFSLRESLGPWALVLALSAESTLQLTLSVVRRLKVEPELCAETLLSRYRSMSFGLKIQTLKEFKKISPAVVKRLLFLPVFGWMHFYTIHLFQNGELNLTESILIHSISPLISLLVRSGVLYWKDLIDCSGKDLFSTAINHRIHLFGILTTLFIQTGAMIALHGSWISDALALYFCWSALTALTLLLSLEPWLGKPLRLRHFTPLALQSTLFLSEPTSAVPFICVTLIMVTTHFWFSRNRLTIYSHVATLRKTFWSTGILLRAEPELMSLNIPYEMRSGKLYLALSTNSDRDAFLNWGRGWILSLKKTANDQSSVTKPEVIDLNEYASLDVKKLKWTQIPQGLGTPELTLDERTSVLKSIHSGMARGMIRGTAQYLNLRLNWKNIGSTVFIRIKEKAP